MTAETEMMRLLERADPVRRGDEPPMIDAAQYLEQLLAREHVVPAVDLVPALHAGIDERVVDAEPSPDKRSGRRWRLFAAAAAAAVLVIAASIVAVERNGNDGVSTVPPVSNTDTHRHVPTSPAVPDGLNGLSPGASASSVTAGGAGLVAVGNEITDGGDVDGVVWTSTDGTTWARVPDEEGVLGGPGIQGITDVTVGGPGLVAVGRGSSVVGSDTYATAAVWTSADGISWSRVPHDDSVFGRATGEPDDIFRMTAVTTGGPGLVAIGERGGASDQGEFSGAWIADRAVGAVWTSIDGITWSRVPHDPAVFGHWPTTSPGSEPVGWGLSASMSDITPGGPGLVVVGDIFRGGFADTATGGGAVWTSPDGLHWTLAADQIEAVNISAVTEGGPGLVAVGATGDTGAMEFDAAVWTSADGTTWSRIPPQPEVLGGPGFQAMSAVYPGGPGLVAIGEADGPTAWTSADGTTWSRVAHDSTLDAWSTPDSLLRLYGFAHRR